MAPLEDASHHACTKKLKCLIWIPIQQLGISQLQHKVKVSLLMLYCSWGSLLVHDVMTTEMGLVVVNELLELEMY